MITSRRTHCYKPSHHTHCKPSCQKKLHPQWDTVAVAAATHKAIEKVGKHNFILGKRCGKELIIFLGKMYFFYCLNLRQYKIKKYDLNMFNFCCLNLRQYKIVLNYHLKWPLYVLVTHFALFQYVLTTSYFLKLV